MSLLSAKPELGDHQVVQQRQTLGVTNLDIVGY